jgi:hypothetical protein
VVDPASPGPATRKASLQVLPQSKDKQLRRTSLIKPIGARGKRLAPERERAKREVRRRSRGICEVLGCERTDIAWAHIFGRGNIVSEPMASSPELTMDLCSIHHDAIDRGFDLDLREQLRWIAVAKVAELVDIAMYLFAGWREDRSAKEALLTLLRWTEEREAA